jgi:hypothetical protein
MTVVASTKKGGAETTSHRSASGMLALITPPSRAAGAANADVPSRAR